MAALVVNQGLQRCGRNTSAVGVSAGTNLNTANWLQTLAIDDGTVALAAGHTALNSGGAITNEFDQAIGTANTIASQTVTHTSTIPTGSGNFTIRRITLHDNVPASVDSTTSTLHSGVDGQTLAKTSDFTIQFTLTHLYSNV